MKISISKARIVAAICISLVFETYVQIDYAKWRTLGREAFLKYEGIRFDFYIAPQHNPAVGFVGVLLVIVFILAAYEGVTALFETLLRRRMSSAQPETPLT